MQVAATWFPENAAPGSFVMFPTMDADTTQRFFGHDFLHVVPPLKTLTAKILRCVVRIYDVWLYQWTHWTSFDMPSSRTFILARAPKPRPQVAFDTELPAIRHTTEAMAQSQAPALSVATATTCPGLVRPASIYRFTVLVILTRQSSYHVSLRPSHVVTARREHRIASIRSHHVQALMRRTVVSIGFPGGNTLSVDHLAAVDAEASNPVFDAMTTSEPKAAASEATASPRAGRALGRIMWACSASRQL